MSRRWRTRALGTAVGWAVAIGMATSAGGCSTDSPPPVESCDAGDGAWVQRTLLALDGRRANSRAEVQVWADFQAKLEAEGLDRVAARRHVARAMMDDDGRFRERWSVFVMDAMQVVRAQFVRDSQWNKVQAARCYGDVSTGGLVDPNDGGSLAAWVRDNPPDSEEAPVPDFNLGRLLGSAIELDDLTPIYRAQLFHMLQYPIAGANVDSLDLEAARRRDFAKIFEAAYSHRDPTCLECHNSNESVTDSPMPELDRTWPVVGLFERSLYGTDGAESAAQVYETIFRVDGVRQDLSLDGIGPWGWAESSCGSFSRPSSDDPLGVEGRFGAVEGLRGSVWELEASLRRGFEELRGVGLTLDEGDVPSTPDAALAYLVSMNITEKVWDELMGAPLTIAHTFPRNAAQRDTLASLTDAFVMSGYSLKALLGEIVVHPLFNPPSPTEACGGVAYPYGAIQNPWSRDDDDESRRGNSVGDGLHHVSSRVVQSALFHAMEWDRPAAFPQSAEDEEFMASLGFFIANFRPGFRGFGFQSKLSLEQAYGACSSGISGDFIQKLVARAGQSDTATVRDALATLKDRLIGEPFIADGEVAALEQIAGVPLTTPTVDISGSDLDGLLRTSCGAYLMSPQNLLEGAPRNVGDQTPALVASEHDYASSCQAIQQSVADAAEVPFVVNCLSTSLTVSAR